MGKTWLSIFLIGGLFGSVSVIGQGEEAFEQGEYEQAENHFRAALEEEDYESQQQKVNFNIAQSLYFQDSLTAAKNIYSNLVGPREQLMRRNQDLTTASWAYNNLGVIAMQSQPGVQVNGGPKTATQQDGQNMSESQVEEAKAFFMDALRLDPENQLARYNYELLMRRQQQQQEQQQEQQEEQEEEQQDEQNQEQQNQDQQDQQDQEQDQEDQQSQPEEENGQQNQQQKQNEGESEQQMDEAQAERLLEAVGQKEKQFIQQLEEKKNKGVPRRDTGPDW